MKAARGTRDENILTSLASRIIRLNIRMTEAERKEFQEKAGVSLSKAAQALLDAFDLDVIVERAGIALSVDKNELSPEQKAQMDIAQKELISVAVAPFRKLEVREYIENIRRRHEQVIDNVNLDSVLFAGYDTTHHQFQNNA